MLNLNYKKSLNYSDKYIKVKLIALTNISNIYLRGKDYKLAHKYINESYANAIKLNDKEEIGRCFYQRGLINRDENKLEESKQNFKKSLDFFNEEENPFQVAEVTSFLAQVETDYKLKLDYLLQSKLMWDKVAPDYMSAVTNAILLANVYLDISEDESLKLKTGITTSNQQLIDQADKFTVDAINYSKNSNNKQNLMDAYSTISRIKFLKNDFKNAYKYSVLNQSLKDSVFSQESKNKIAAIESQKEITLRDNQIQNNQVKLKLKHKQNILLLISLGLLFIIGILLFFQNKSRKRNNNKLEKLNADLDIANKSKIKLFGILNHDLRSPVVNFIHYMQFKKESDLLIDEETKNRIENSTLDSAKNLLYSMEDILQWSKSQMENFKPEPKTISLNSMFDEVKNHFSSFENIEIIVENEQNVKINTDENYLKTIVRNLTGNAIKALESIEKPTIIWKTWQENNQTFISISDNGNGTDLDQFNALYDEKVVAGIKSGLGLHLIRDLAKAINCDIKVDSQKNSGTTFTLLFNS